jgi:type II secretory ATPase GspE/PulE/Tfp pilus assembly ATPase PilB-like protein
MSHAPSITAVPDRVDRMLDAALARRASDLHLDPREDAMAIRARIDGLLEDVEQVDPAVGAAMVTRLMVMAQLLTYRRDQPQEGRTVFAGAAPGRAAELRVSVIPTTHGLRAVVRLPAELDRPCAVGDLGLPAGVLAELQRLAASDQGLLLVTGPAGAGKTTTLYALLRHIVQTRRGSSVVAIEDPVESDLPGVTQVQVRDEGPMTYAAALRSVLRQDPQVLMLGEIRDAATATIAVQAALSGHRLLATMHAGAPGAAIARLLEMGVEPYQVAGALDAVVTQRLVRRIDGRGGYAGRAPLAEIAPMTAELRRAVVARSDAQALGAVIAARPGFQSLRQSGQEAARNGVTDEAELLRVLGAS